jgi:mevalonate kinase
MPLKASAPGSLMLLGEYAVLYGRPGVVCAVDKRISVILTPRVDHKIEIFTKTLGSYVTDLSHLSIEQPFHFVLAVIKHYQPKLKQGFSLEIHSEFSDKMGLGSSAAVTVAMLAALISWLEIKISPLDFVRLGRDIVRSVQGMASGADIAASVYGGIVHYVAHPIAAEKLSVTYPLSVLYAGFKTPTSEAIKQVQQYFSAYPSLFRHLCNSIGQCALEGVELIRKQDWASLGEIMNLQQCLMDSLGVSSLLLDEMVDDLRQQQGVLGAKISGSGLGDCVIGLGQLSSCYQSSHHHAGVQPVPVEMTLQGVYCEKI